MATGKDYRLALLTVALVFVARASAQGGPPGMGAPAPGEAPVAGDTTGARGPTAGGKKDHDEMSQQHDHNSKPFQLALELELEPEPEPDLAAVLTAMLFAPFGRSRASVQRIDRLWKKPV